MIEAASRECGREIHFLWWLLLPDVSSKFCGAETIVFVAQTVKEKVLLRQRFKLS